MNKLLADFVALVFYSETLAWQTSSGYSFLIESLWCNQAMIFDSYMFMRKVIKWIPYAMLIQIKKNYVTLKYISSRSLLRAFLFLIQIVEWTINWLCCSGLLLGNSGMTNFFWIFVLNWKFMVQPSYDIWSLYFH